MIASAKELLNARPYCFSQKDKGLLLLDALQFLTEQHRSKCLLYDQLLSLFYPDFTKAAALAEIPHFPVSLFKTHEWLSIPREEIFKLLMSSGTTSSIPSKIYLDRETAALQTQALAKIMMSFLGHQRLPMLLVEQENFLKDPKRFSARAAGVLGMLSFGRDPLYALDANLELKHQAVLDWAEKYKHTPVLIFGFTFMLWKFFLKKMEKFPDFLNQAIVIHTGGWKKLLDESVDNEQFKRKFRDVLGIERVHNFYGMAEQVGSVFMECEKGLLHCPNFAEIIIRDPQTWQEAPTGVPGVLQTLSILPGSYPGHSLLTEDLGRVEGIDSCPCGRNGKAFQVIGRIPKVELRGCSDTFSPGDAE
jgi:hypothetical protein